MYSTSYLYFIFWLLRKSWQLPFGQKCDTTGNEEYVFEST